MSITRILFSTLVPTLLALPLFACDPEAGDDLGDEETRDELSANKIVNSNYFIVTGPDYRKCVSPICGGYFVGRVNTDVARCADGTWQEQCHMYDVDLSALNLSKSAEDKAREAIGTSVALVRGQLVKADVGAAVLADVLVASEVWIGVTGNEPDGHFSRVDDTGIVCITYPCPTYIERSLNTNLIDNLDGVDLSTSGATYQQVADGLTELNASGLLVAGTHTIVTGPGGTMNALEASEFYTRLTAQ
ncbi:DUF6748 domain-containing protein [Nannocystaceae bacterium ST9]